PGGRRSPGQAIAAAPAGATRIPPGRPRTKLTRSGAPPAAPVYPGPSRPASRPARPGAPAWRRPATLREGRASFQLDQLEAVAAGGFLALRPLAREQARAALTTQTAEAERRKVMLARLQRSGRRWRGGRQAHQQLVDVAPDLPLAAGDPARPRIPPPPQAPGTALLEKHLDHRH